MNSPKLSSRIQQLREDLINLEYTKHREVRDIKILHDNEAMKEPLVVRKALAFALLLKKISYCNTGTGTHQ